MSRRRALLAMGGIKKPTYYWPFDGDANEHMKPEVMNFYGAVFDDALFGQGVFFNTTNSGVTRVSASLNLPKTLVYDENGDKPFALSVWVKKQASNGTSGLTWTAIRNTIIGLSGADWATTKWCLGIDTVTDKVIMRFTDTNDGVKQLRYESVPAIERNEWELIQMNYDGQKGVEIFINNVQVATTLIDDGYNTMYGGLPTYGVGISCHSQNVNYASLTMLGGIADLGFWNGYNLTQKDRDLIWNSGIGRKLRNI